jgi:hypothetical protein
VTLVVPFPCPWPPLRRGLSCWPAAVAGLVIRSRPRHPQRIRRATSQSGRKRRDVRGFPRNGSARPLHICGGTGRAGRARGAIAASPVTNPCGTRASLRSRPGARPRCPRSSGGNSERDGRRALSPGFGRTTGWPPSGRTNRPARHIASLPSSLPVCSSVLAALCALRTGRTCSRMMATRCEVGHRRTNCSRIRASASASFAGTDRPAASAMRRLMRSSRVCQIAGASRMRVPGSARKRLSPHRPRAPLRFRTSSNPKPDPR